MNRGFLVLKGGNVEVTGAPEIISVLPLGHVISDKGEFDVDEESFRVMKAQVTQRGVDLVIDYEHQTLKGVQAPAAGWIKELMLKNSQIQARVEWTPTAKKYLQNKEYRYLSPVITVRKSDSKATGLHSLALTNTPAIEGMAPLVNSQNYVEGIGDIDFKAIAEILGLSELATAKDVIHAISKFLNENEYLRKEVEALMAEKDENPATREGVHVGLKAKYPIENATAITLDDEILHICERLGVSKEDLAKYGGIGIALDDTEALKRNKTDDATRRICQQLGISEADLIKYNIK